MPKKIPAVDNSIHTLQDDDTSSNPLSSTLSSINNEDDSFVPSVDSTFYCDEASGSSDGFSTGSPLEEKYFEVPYGNVGDAFVQELARLFQSYADSSYLESIALYAAMAMSALLLQKPIGKVSKKDFSNHLERHLLLWKDGDVESLLQEGRAIQSRLKFNNHSNSSNSIAKRFSDLMLIGDVKGAIRLLSNRENGTVLSLDTIINDRSVKEVLYDKHPIGQPIKPSALVSGPSHSISHPILFDQLTPDLIRATALSSSGSSGPSGLDAACWKHLCTSFKSSINLCRALSSLAKRICTAYVDPQGLYPFLAGRLIAIDKLPGVRPIGIGEVVRRIIGKAVLSVVGRDILEVTGSDQLCAGQPGGCEAAVHAVRSIFDSMQCEAVLLVDASNAFNALNRNRLASLLSERQSKPYSTTLNWIRCRLSFSLLRSAIVCFRGACSSYHRPIHSSSNIDLALSEGQVLQ
uniref:Reverse transcriptase domain-containing protein n=1 Tax=Amphimedon queenslandica TaxID=400682 RepID=A0A1X7TIP9_AMPQE